MSCMSTPSLWDVPVRCRCSFELHEPYTNLTLPVSNSCIIPCFSSAVLARRASKAPISASMSLSTSAIAVCSSLVAHEGTPIA
jgi:hypothetical protein